MAVSIVYTLLLEGSSRISSTVGVPSVRALTVPSCLEMRVCPRRVVGVALETSKTGPSRQARAFVPQVESSRDSTSPTAMKRWCHAPDERVKLGYRLSIPRSEGQRGRA